jgi:hypothetical protein
MNGATSSELFGRYVKHFEVYTNLRAGGRVELAGSLAGLRGATNQRRFMKIGTCTEIKTIKAASGTASFYCPSI